MELWYTYNCEYKQFLLIVLFSVLKREMLRAEKRTASPDVVFSFSIVDSCMPLFYFYSSSVNTNIYR